jgi:ATP-dependent helicase/nuclease subunit A
MYQIITAAAKENDKESDKESEFVDMGNEVLQNKCRAAYKLIEGLRYDAMSMSLERLIRKIFDVTDLMAITALYLDSDKKRANLRLLLEYASSYEKNGRDGVTGFLHFIDSVSENDSAFKQATSVTNGGETVKVQTYHKSKGLEYPFVFLCSLDDKLITKQETDTLIRLNNDEGVGIKFFEKRLNVKRKELFSAGLEERSENDLKSERMRILYVGCTRARERLFVVYALNYASNSSIEKCKENMLTLLRTDLGGERISPDAVCGCGTMLEWLTLVLAKHPDRDTLAEWLGADLSRIPTDEAAEDVKLVYNIKDPEEPETAEADDDTDTAEADDRIVDSLLKKYRYEYKNTDSLLPSKLTVTEIVRGEKEKKLGEKNPEFFPNLPRLNEELDKLTAAEKGTFTHKFMELANYDNAEKSVSDELARLVNGGFFTKKEASGVYVKRLEAFFSGEFYLRMKRSPDLRREQKFLVSADDLPDCPELRGVMGSGGMIQGIADCIFKEDDGWVLVDYKTDNFKNEDEMSEYGTQLKLYKAAFELIYGEKVRSCYIYSFKLGVGKEFDL